MDLEEMRQLKKPELIAEVVRLMSVHNDMVSHLYALEQFKEDVKGISFARHACSSCGLMESEYSEHDGKRAADRQWKEKIKEILQKLKLV